MKMSFFIWHIYYYRAFCTVTNDDFADGNLLSHPSASFGIPTMYLLLFFFFSQLLGLLVCFGFAFLLHFFYISVAFLSYMFNSLSACAACLDRILRLTASRDESAGCTNFPHWTLASSLLCVFVQVAKCICLSSQTYLFRFDVTSKSKNILKKSYILTVWLIFVLFWAMFSEHWLRKSEINSSTNLQHIRYFSSIRTITVLLNTTKAKIISQYDLHLYSSNGTRTTRW